MSFTSPPSQQQRPMSPVRRIAIVTIWLFPYLLAVGAYFAGGLYEPAAALRTPVTFESVPPSVYGGLLVLVLFAGVWLIGEFFSVTSRETVVMALQFDAVFSAVTAILFTGAAGWFIGRGELEWWFIVPWIATIIDALTAAWLGINNAAQKPFLGKQGAT